MQKKSNRFLRRRNASPKTTSLRTSCFVAVQTSRASARVRVRNACAGANNTLRVFCAEYLYAYFSHGIPWGCHRVMVSHVTPWDTLRTHGNPWDAVGRAMGSHGKFSHVFTKWDPTGTHGMDPMASPADIFPWVPTAISTGSHGIAPCAVLCLIQLFSPRQIIYEVLIVRLSRCSLRVV